MVINGGLASPFQAVFLSFLGLAVPADFFSLARLCLRAVIRSTTGARRFPLSAFGAGFPALLLSTSCWTRLRECVMKLFGTERFDKGLGELLGKIDFLFR